jgi:hypothetical protein
VSTHKTAAAGIRRSGDGKNRSEAEQKLPHTDIRSPGLAAMDFAETLAARHTPRRSRQDPEQDLMKSRAQQR